MAYQVDIKGVIDADDLETALLRLSYYFSETASQIRWGDTELTEPNVESETVLKCDVLVKPI